MLSTVRRLRHGPLAFLGPVWLVLGRLFRRVVARLPGLSVRQHIGRYGPFRLDPIFAFSNLEAWGTGHNECFDACVEACRGKRCVLDVGAHVGYVALPVSRVLAEGGRLVCFEPADANVRLLRRHLERNGVRNAEVVQALVGERDEDGVRFYESTGHHGQNSIVLKAPQVMLGEGGGYRTAMRRQVCLDSFCAERGLSPEVIKIDVEGAEVGVIAGACRTLRRCRPTLVLSVHPSEIELAGHSVAELARLLDELDYEIRDARGGAVPVPGFGEFIVMPRASADRAAGRWEEVQG